MRLTTTLSTLFVILFTLLSSAYAQAPIEVAIPKAEKIASDRTVLVQTRIIAPAGLNNFVGTELKAVGVVYSQNIVITDCALAHNDEATTIDGGAVIKILKKDKKTRLAAFAVSTRRADRLELSDYTPVGLEVYTASAKQSYAGNVIARSPEKLLTSIVDPYNNKETADGSGIFDSDGHLISINLEAAVDSVTKKAIALSAIPPEHLEAFLTDPHGSKIECRLCHKKCALNEAVTDPGHYGHFLHETCKENATEEDLAKAKPDSKWKKVLKPWKWFSKK